MYLKIEYIHNSTVLPHCCGTSPILYPFKRHCSTGGTTGLPSETSGDRRGTADRQ